MSNCPNCPALQAEVSRLQVENALLLNEVQRLRKILTALAQSCYSIAQDAAAKMQKHMPRAEWAFLKGKYEVASSVYNTLRGEG